MLQVNNPVHITARNNVTLVRDVERVHDTTFLPGHAQTLCADKETYWATERYGEVLTGEQTGMYGATDIERGSLVNKQVLLGHRNRKGPLVNKQVLLGHRNRKGVTGKQASITGSHK